MRSLVVLMLVLACAGCTSPMLPSPAEADLVLVNGSSRSILYLAIERETSNVVDPAPTWRVADHADRRVDPGEEAEVEVEGYSRGRDVRLFLYVVPAGEEGEGIEAPMASVQTFRHEDLSRSGYRVVIQQIP